MSRTPAEQQLSSLARVWWLPLGVGLISIAAGVVVLVKPGNSLKTIAVIVGVFIAIDGVIALLAALRSSTESRGLTALMGVVGLIVGVMLIKHPANGITAIALLIGIWLIVIGAIRGVLAFEERERAGWRAFVAAIEVIAGIVIVSSPRIGLASLAILIGVSLIVNGASLLLLGGALRQLHKEAPQPPQRTHAAPA